MKILSDPTHLRKFVCNNLFGLRFLGKLRSIPSAFLVIDFLNKNLRYVTVLIDDDYVTFLFCADLNFFDYYNISSGAQKRVIPKQA